MTRKSSSRIVPILNTLEDCFSELDKIVKSKDKAQIRGMSEDDFSLVSHHNLGAWIRNNWIRKGRITFLETLREKGAKHIDDISTIILTSYYRYLHGKDINLDEQLMLYRNYWLINATPRPDMYPKGVKSLSFFAKYYYKIDETQEGCFYIMLEDGIDKYWLYDYFYGWVELETRDMDELLNRDSSHRINILETLYNI